MAILALALAMKDGESRQSWRGIGSVQTAPICCCEALCACCPKDGYLFGVPGNEEVCPCWAVPEEDPPSSPMGVLPDVLYHCSWRWFATVATVMPDGVEGSVTGRRGRSFWMESVNFPPRVDAYLLYKALLM